MGFVYERRWWPWPRVVWSVRIGGPDRVATMMATGWTWTINGAIGAAEQAHEDWYPWWLRQV